MNRVGGSDVGPNIRTTPYNSDLLVKTDNPPLPDSAYEYTVR